MGKDPTRTLASVEGTITMRDGTKRSFSIGTDFGWQQWGETPSNLGNSVDVIEAMCNGLKDADVPVVSDHDEDNEYDPDEECSGCDGSGRVDCIHADDDDHDMSTCENNCDGAGYECPTCDGTGRVAS